MVVLVISIHAVSKTNVTLRLSAWGSVGLSRLLSFHEIPVHHDNRGVAVLGFPQWLMHCTIRVPVHSSLLYVVNIFKKCCECCVFMPIGNHRRVKSSVISK